MRLHLWLTARTQVVLTRRDSLSRKNSQYTKEASFSRDNVEPPKKLAGVDPNRKHKLEQDIIACVESPLMLCAPPSPDSPSLCVIRAKAKVAELLGKQDEYSDKIRAIEQKT